MNFKKILNDLIEMQTLFLESIKEEDKPFLHKEIEEGKGRIATLEILCSSETEKYTLKLAGDGFVEYATEEEAIHTIRMSEDTFIAILIGEETFEKALNRGHVAFFGENWFYHSQKWARALRRLNYILKQVRRK